MTEMTLGTGTTVDRIAETIGELPSSPAIVSAVMGLTSNLDADVGEISRVLAADQSLTAKVLRLSNSSFYGRSKRVSSLEESILILGFFTVRSMVVATSTRSMFEGRGQENAQRKLWNHSLSTAIAGRQIAARVKHPAKDEIFIAALLHDIGKLILLKNLGGNYEELVDRVEHEHGCFATAEEESFAFNHSEVAAVLLTKWSFPDNLTEAVARHHDLTEYDGAGPVPIAHVVHLGNHLAKRLEVGFADERIENLAGLKSAVALGLSEIDLDEMFEEFQEHYESEARIFEED